LVDIPLEKLKAYEPVSDGTSVSEEYLA